MPKETKKARILRLRAEISAIIEPLGYNLDSIIPPKKGLAQSNGDDCVQTMDSLALAVVRHFQPFGTILDPCAGEGAFGRAYRQYNAENGEIQRLTRIDEMEITAGTDFLALSPDDPRRWNWIITNPPWSLLRPFTVQAMRVSDNIVWLDKMNAFGFKARIRLLEEAGFGIKEYALFEQPPTWPGMGLQLAAIHLAKTRPGEGLGAPKISRLNWKPKPKSKA